MGRYLYSQPDNAVLYDLGLTQTQYRLYNIMVDMMNKKTRLLTVKVRVLAKRLGRAIITTRKHLSVMADKGVIIRIFNKSKSNPRVNTASTFVICGRFAKRYEGSEYAGDYPCTENQKRNYPSVEKYIQEDLEESFKREDLEDTLKGEAPLPKDLRNTDQLTENPEALITPISRKSPEKPENPKPSNQGKVYDLTGVPDIMRTTAEYFLFKTGKTALTAKDVEAFCEMSETHMPVRVQKEIDTAIKRFQQDGRSLDKLHVGYIAASLSHQQSYDPDAPHPSAKKHARRNKKAAIPPAESAPVQESVPELADAILPVEEAERVISEYTPAVKKNEGVPAALEELFGKIRAREQELADEYAETLPTDDEGLPDWTQAEKDEDDFPKMPKLSLAEYLRLKYPEADDEELQTDTVRDQCGLQQAFETDRTCANCYDPEACPFNRKKGKLTAFLQQDMGGRKILEVGYLPYFRCKHDKSKPDPEFETRMKHGGLSEFQAKQTFEAYEHEGMPAEVVSAKAKAILAAKNHSSLILAGKPGTGKTHLATAIAIEAILEDRRAIIVTVPDMLDELRQAARERTDFLGHLLKYQQVPCLVLDDLGKENTTQAGLKYLYQIIDYRYREGLQTVVTTNAFDMAGLMNPWNADKIEPLVSRLLENGEWVTIRSAENHRLKKPALSESKPEGEVLPAPLPATEPDTITAVPNDTAETAEAPILPSETVELYGKIQAREAECIAQHKAYFDSLTVNKYGRRVFPDSADMPELPALTFALTFEDYLHMKFPEAEEEELRTDRDGKVHEEYSGFSEYEAMEEAFDIDRFCATCQKPEECCLSDEIKAGKRYPTIVRQTTPQGKACIGIKYEEHLVCKHKCANCPVYDAVAGEKLPVPMSEPLPPGTHAPVPETSKDTEACSVVDTAPERNKCHSLEEIVSYRLAHGRMPREYDELDDNDRWRVQMELLEHVETEPKAEYNPYEDEDLWKEDEDEYRLAGDEKPVDYDDPALAME